MKKLIFGLGMAMVGLANAQTPEYPAGYDVATNQLTIPCVEVTSLPGVYQVTMALASTAPMTFRVTSAVSIQTLVACKSATFDSKTGLLTIPKVELTQSMGIYSVTLQQTNPPQYIFSIATLKAL